MPTLMTVAAVLMSMSSHAPLPQESVYAVSYLAGSGYTLTVVLDFATGRMVGFASGREEWYPGRGTFEVVR